MTFAATAQMCRLVVCGPDRRIEVAVPAHILVADLLPALLHHLGADLADTGMLHGGWVLQRLGESPFDEDSTVASLGLRDGDTVHLRPRSDQIPPLDFDDLIDGVATGLADRTGTWRPEMTRWAALGLQVALLATGLVALALPGPAAPRALAAVVLALVAMVAAVTVAQVLKEYGTSLTYGAAAVGHAGLAGLLAPGPSYGFGGPYLFSGGAAVLAAALVGAVLLKHARAFFAAVITGTVVALGGFALMAFVPLGGVESASVVLMVGTVLNTLVPQIAFRLSGLRLDPLPTEREHVNQDLDPVPSQPLLDRGPVLDRYMTALYVGLASPVAVAAVVAGQADGWAPGTLVALVALIRLLAARPMASGWHRLALAVPAVAGLASVVLHQAGTYPVVQLLVPALLVPLGGAALFAVARTLPQRRPMPYWGRAGDLLQSLSMLVALPVLLAVLGVYQYARGFGG